MRYGICLLPDMPWTVAKPLWQRAEELGFDHAWTYDHLVWGGLPDARWFSCLPTLTAAASVTSTLGIGSFVLSPNFRHPVALSRELQTLADISGGRLLAGLGVGDSPDDGILGQPGLTVRERVNRFQEFVRLLDLTLTDDHVTFDGDYYSARDMRLAGGPVRPRLPLLLAGDGPRQIRFAARKGDGWVTQGGRGADTLDEWFARAQHSWELMAATAQEAGSPCSGLPSESGQRPGTGPEQCRRLRRADRAGRRSRLHRRDRALAAQHRALPGGFRDPRPTRRTRPAPAGLIPGRPRGRVHNLSSAPCGSTRRSRSDDVTTPAKTPPRVTTANGSPRVRIPVSAS